MDKPYNNGVYIGCISLPHNYPFSAPTVLMHTPSGRFEPNKNLCISGLSHFHSETWTPALTIHKQIIGFLSIMLSDKKEDKGVGHIYDNKNDTKQVFASKSLNYNKTSCLLSKTRVENCNCSDVKCKCYETWGNVFNTLFPEFSDDKLMKIYQETAKD